MGIELSSQWTIALNLAVLPLIQLGCAFAFTRLPANWFDAPLPSRLPMRQGTPGFLKTWKRWLPDGAAWFDGGFHKRSLTSRDPDYLRRFIIETRRGEACHWLAMLLSAVPFQWNPWWGCAVIGLYALVANLPCILLQRVNRARLTRMLARHHQASSAEAKSARS
jgi:glycosyl-4,4'-diaponeurosporenoate acyltransferase